MMRHACSLLQACKYVKPNCLGKQDFSNSFENHLQKWSNSRMFATHFLKIWAQYFVVIYREAASSRLIDFLNG